MRKLFFARLAVTSLQKNRRTYFPFLLTCIGVVLMFYNACALTFHPSMHGSLQELMYMGTIVTGIFSAIFLFYTHSFLMKRRKKELGLFHLLGMEKRHIGRILLWESLLVSACSIVLGLLLGILFSKLVTLLLYQLLHFNPDFQFTVSLQAIGITTALFICIFLLILINSFIQVYRSQTIDLLKGSNVGEREPKTRYLLTGLGVLTLGGGYAIALLVKNAFAALHVFFIAVLLVMIGTYCLFAAGSIALLKALKKNKRFYYQTRHFTAISGMMYRMKQNAVGLANICLMSTAVLVMISTTVSMYAGMENLLSNRFPTDFSLQAYYTPAQPVDVEKIESAVASILSDSGKAVSDYQACNYLTFQTLRSGNTYSARQDNLITSTEDSSVVIAMTADAYTNLTGKTLTLNAGEIAFNSTRQEDEVNLLGQTYRVAQHLSAAPSLGKLTTWMVDTIYVVLPSQTDLYALYDAQHAVYQKDAGRLQFQVSFNLTMPDEEKAAYTSDVLVAGIKHSLPDISPQISSKQLSRASFFELYGGLLFLGIFLGALFLMATVLIIYYKQVVEGYEDQQRFKIMQQVGMSTDEVKRSIGSQVLTVFSLPILAALVHIVVAFPILTKLLAMLNLTNTRLFALCMVITAFIFILIYGLVYLLTARVYYKIVRQ